MKKIKILSSLISLIIILLLCFGFGFLIASFEVFQHWANPIILGIILAYGFFLFKERLEDLFTTWDL